MILGTYMPHYLILSSFDCLSSISFLVNEFNIITEPKQGQDRQEKKQAQKKHAVITGKKNEFLLTSYYWLNSEKKYRLTFSAQSNKVTK